MSVDNGNRELFKLLGISFALVLSFILLCIVGLYVLDKEFKRVHQNETATFQWLHQFQFRYAKTNDREKHIWKLYLIRNKNFKDDDVIRLKTLTQFTSALFHSLLDQFDDFRFRKDRVS